MNRTWQGKAFHLAVVISSIGLGATAYAQAAAPAADEDADAAGEGGAYFYDLDQALLQTSVASKTIESLEDAPSSVTVFTRDDIVNMGITSLEELLNFAPGFQVTRDVEQGIDWRFAARGRGSAVSESVLVLVDGQRLNDLYTGGVGILNHRINVGNIKKVSIIRGPGSALYGSNAFLGVVSIETVEGLTDLFVQGGSFYSRTGQANVSTQAGPVSISAFVGAFGDDGQHYDNATSEFGKSGPTTDPQSGFDIYSTLRWKGFTLRLRHMDRQDNDFLIFSSLANDTQYLSTRQSSALLEYEADLGSSFHLDVGTGISIDNWKSLIEVIPPNFELFPGFTTQQPYYGGPVLQTYYSSSHLDGRWTIAKWFTLSGGVQYDNANYTHIGNLGNFDELTLEPQPEVTELNDETRTFQHKQVRQIFGAYLQGQNTVAGLHFTYGLRFDHYNDFGSALNPRVAIVYDTPIKSWVKVMYGQAFRAPNYLELYDAFNPVDFGNPNLKAETVRTFEAAYIQKVAFLEASVTFFHNTLSNLIDYGAPGDPALDPTGAPQFVNTPGDQLTRGFEFELRTTPIHGFSAYGNYTHFIDHGLQVSRDAAALALNFHVWKLNLNVNGVFRGPVELLPDQGSYVLANVVARFAFNDHLSVQLNLQNLLDTQYVSISKFEPTGVPNRGREVLLGFRADL